MADSYTNDLLMRQVKDPFGTLLPARAVLKLAGTDVSVADVGGETVATFGLNAGVVTETATTTNATPANIDLDVLDGTEGNLNLIGVRVCGQTAGHSMILRDMVVAIRGDGTGWLKPGGSGSDGPYQDSGIVYTNDDANLATANIVCNTISGGNLRVVVTGLAGTTINWTAQAWVQVIA